MITAVPPPEQKQKGDVLEQNLLADLARINTQSRNETIILELHDNAGHLIGGVTADTSYGWVLIKIIWVSEQVRGQGFGQQLMQAVENYARALGCHAAWLETSNPSAQPFYQSLGYSNFGTLENTPDQTPPEHKRWFMKKSL